MNHTTGGLFNWSALLLFIWIHQCILSCAYE